MEMEENITDFTVVDIETTGLDPKRDKITEIAAIRVENHIITGKFHTLVNPGRKLEERIVELTGIRDEDLKDAPHIQDVIGDFLDFESTGCLLGHSILFDYSFLKRASVNAGMKFERNGIDTLMIARKYLADLESRALPYLCRHFDIAHNPHRAMSDVEATYELYKLLHQSFFKEEDDHKLFEPSPLIYQVKKEGPVTKHQIEQLERFLSYHQIESAYDIKEMTKNEASRYMDILISQYGRIPARHV